jgi:hypothetical protein
VAVVDHRDECPQLGEIEIHPHEGLTTSGCRRVLAAVGQRDLGPLAVRA